MTWRIWSPVGSTSSSNASFEPSSALTPLLLWTRSISPPSHGKQHPPRDTALAMSQENVDTFLEGVEAFNRRDVERWLDASTRTPSSSLRALRATTRGAMT
jgi:hypothetical protein